MASAELIAHVRLKPNCDLENTRASLIMRRIGRLCENASCYPGNVAGNRETIPYLQDHGFFIRFTATAPEQVMSAIRSSFFVEQCTLVKDEGVIPPFRASDAAVPSAWTGEAGAAAAIDEESERDSELLELLTKFDQIMLALRLYAADHERDKKLEEITFAQMRTVDALRTTVARSRVEPFGSIAPQLYAFVDECASRHHRVVDLVIEDNGVEVDRSVLVSLKEMLKHLARIAVRDNVEDVEERLAQGKPPRAVLRVFVENDDSTVICRLEHDGAPFEARRIGALAEQGGLLTRPLDAYSDEEIGRLVMLPHFIEERLSDSRSGSAFDLSEVSSILRRAGGRGEVRNTEGGTVETSLFIPVPYTAFDVALFCIDGQRLALPAQYIEHFEPFDPERADQGAYRCEDGAQLPLLVDYDLDYDRIMQHRRIVMRLNVYGLRGVFPADVVVGYEHMLVNRLSSVIERRVLHKDHCLGYTMLDNGRVHLVLNARTVMNDLMTKSRNAGYVSLGGEAHA